MSKDSRDNPEPKFTVWSDSVERYIRRGIVILAVLLCLSQLVLQIPAARYWLTTTDESEGVPFPGIAP
ncbi:MAG: hypothetical protein J7559_17245 [Cohnella sp.]|nr:hypothetical protein [Cohnella sp.]